MTPTATIDLGGPAVVAEFAFRDSGPSTRLAPVLVKLSREHPSIRFVSLDLDDRFDEQLALQYKVTQPSTVLLLREGEEVSRFLGIELSRDDILQHLGALSAF